MTKSKILCPTPTWCWTSLTEFRPAVHIPCIVGGATSIVFFALPTVAWKIVGAVLLVASLLCLPIVTSPRPVSPTSCSRDKDCASNQSCKQEKCATLCGGSRHACPRGFVCHQNGHCVQKINDTHELQLGSWTRK